MTLAENVGQVCESGPSAGRGVFGGIEQLCMMVTDVVRKRYHQERIRFRGRAEAILHVPPAMMNLMVGLKMGTLHAHAVCTG